MKKITRVLAVVIYVVLLLSSVCAVGAQARVLTEAEDNGYIEMLHADSVYSAPKSSSITRFMFDFLEKVASALVKVISSFTPTPVNWISADDYVPANTNSGTADFLDKPAAGAQWQLGYSSASLISGLDIFDGSYYVAGSISLDGKAVTKLYDDLRVRTVALSDGSGRGTAVFVVLDAYGMSLNSVREIRERLEGFIADNNLIAVNVSVLHQHSAVDTFGMNGDIFEMIKVNPFKTIQGKSDLINGKNDKYMENLYRKAVASVREAVNNMENGDLYYVKSDVSEYLYDKRDPMVNDTYMNTFVFTPYRKSSRPTFLVESMIHCVSLGASTTEVSGDYPYYFEQQLNEQENANMFMFLGAEQSNTSNRNAAEVDCITEDMTSVEKAEAIGRAMATELIEASHATRIEVAPLLNVKYSEVELKLDNQILVFAGKNGLFDTNIVRKGLNTFSLITEIGYIEIGTKFALASFPGEMAPELIYGGTLPADVAWTGTDWTLPSVQDIVGDGRKVIPLGISNDQVGYVVPDNNHMSMFAEESGSIEFVSIGKNTASTLINAYSQLVDSVK